MGESWDPDLVSQAAGVEGYEARFITQTPRYNRQILMLWGPQSDLGRDPRWGRSEEVYGEDPFLNGTMAVAFIHGLQGDDPKYWQAAALLKHFLANENENDRTGSSSDFDRAALLGVLLRSLSHGLSRRRSQSRHGLLQRLEWHADGRQSHPPQHRHRQVGRRCDLQRRRRGEAAGQSAHTLFPDQEAAVVACLKAGINQFLDTYKDETKARSKDGSVTEAEIDALLRRKFRVTIRLGLLDPPRDGSVLQNQRLARALEHRHAIATISQKMALESVVLLKNADDFLPLDKRRSLKSIAVIGPLADVVHWDWYGGMPPYAVTPLDGIKAEVGPDVTSQLRRRRTPATPP